MLPRIAERRGAGLLVPIDDGHRRHANETALPRRHRRPSRPRSDSPARAGAGCRVTARDLVIANGENAAGGAGITRENMLEILVGRRRRDHHRQSRLGQARNARVHRQRAAPAAAGQLSGRHARRGFVRGRPRGTASRVGVINVMGRVFLQAIDDPFRAAEREIARVREDGATGDLRRHARRGDVGENRAFVLPRRQGRGGDRHAHARADRR